MRKKRVLEQAAAIPYRFKKGKLEVLLVTSKSRNHWIVPKGLIESKQSAHDAARVEAYEEAGIMGTVRGHPLTSFTYEKWGAICRVRVYRMEMTEVLSEWPESKFRKRMWVEADKIIFRNIKGYFKEPLRIAVARLKQLLGSAS